MVKYLLQIHVSADMAQWYQDKCVAHNAKATEAYADAGFDLGCPTETMLTGRLLYGYQLETAMYKSDTDIDLNSVNLNDMTPSAFYLYPRSSISSTPLRLANSVGIIDSGYRGELKACFDCGEPYTLKKYQRVVQVCTPTLEPMFVQVVETLTSTARGEGGFGSTGV